MRVILFAAASSLALGLAGCAPRVDYAHRTALDCPDRQGQLERTSISADRKTCTYKAGAVEVSLQLTPVSGSPEQTLEAVEASLVGPAAAAAPGAPAPPAPPAPPAKPGGASATDAAKASEQAEADARGSGASGQDWDTGHGKTVVQHGGKAVVVAGDDDAHINLPGLHIDADDDQANIRMGGLQIDASDNEATVHVLRDVRLRGQAFSREKRGVRATFIAKRENLPGGYRFVGYQASGPRVGPLTVAVVRSHDEIDDSNRLYHDIQRLVRRNGGA